jgi:hypothetical protein
LPKRGARRESAALSLTLPWAHVLHVHPTRHRRRPLRQMRRHAMPRLRELRQPARRRRPRVSARPATTLRRSH